MRYVCKPCTLNPEERTFGKGVVRGNHSRVRKNKRVENGRERRMQV